MYKVLLDGSVGIVLLESQLLCASFFKYQLLYNSFELSVDVTSSGDSEGKLTKLNSDIVHIITLCSC